ncbi:MT-A70-domain-containing protein [Xylaria flabelliformis]|nr:MT-A70-domain-containing protein [Xylaria flabelliformis]
MQSSVLFKSLDDAIVVIDIPRSLEEAQVLPGHNITRRIVSVPPIETPWQVPEPKKDTAKYVSPSTAVAELMTLESVKTALEVVKDAYDGPWCLPRVTGQQADGLEQTGTIESNGDTNANAAQSHKRKYKSSSPVSKEDKETSTGSVIPEQSCHLLGTVDSQRETFLRNAPQFDLIVLDPPWPNRSVKRKSDSYNTVYGTEEARNLLLQIPIASHLKRDGLVAIWVTNKASVTDLITGPGGILAQWGLEPIGEWIWLKITSVGKPIFDIELVWRKPWERLLIARKMGSLVSLPMSTKVILAVPDIHSRKPNVRGLFEDILPKNYTGLEVFARNLTAGWWSWGNEVLLFQQGHHWVPLENAQADRS